MTEGKTREIKICVPEEIFSLFLPKEAVGHLFKAKKEILLGLRSIIDAKIAALEKIEEKKGVKKKKINIE